jgi:hypothetical protein
VRRKPGALVPFEIAICEAADDLRRRGIEEFHGYLIAKEIKADADASLLTAHGTLHRALGRLDAMALLQSRWEDHAIAATHDGRQGKRQPAVQRPHPSVDDDGRATDW